MNMTPSTPPFSGSSKVTLENFLTEFDQVEVGRLLYTLSSLHDMGEEITSAEHQDIKSAMANLLRMLMGTILCTRASVMVYAKFKYSLQVLASRGMHENFYLRLDPKEVSLWQTLHSPLTLANVAEYLPVFCQSNIDILKRLEVRLLIPLLVREHLVGCLLLGDKLNKLPYSSTDLILLEMMARQVGIDITQFQLVDELKQTSERLRKQKAELVEANMGVQKMSDISMRFISILDETKLFNAVLEEMIASTSATKGIIVRFDPIRDGLTVLCFKNTESFPQRTLLPYRQYEGLLKALQSGEIFMGTLEERRLWQVEAQYMLCMPIKSKSAEQLDNVVSHLLIVLDKEKRGGGVLTFNERDEAMLISFANYVSILIENVRNYELATKDSMTQLYVRRYFDQRLTEELNKSIQLSKFFSVLIMDIDHFKHVNDTFGHQVGDQVIKLVALTIQRNIRTDVDIAARYGGEEFTLIMPDADSDTALRVAERIRQAVERTDVSHLVTGRNITVSLGVATFPGHGKTTKALLEASDIALYRSKGSGRNKVSLYDDDY